jgi:hypothetical protein
MMAALCVTGCDPGDPPDPDLPWDRERRTRVVDVVPDLASGCDPESAFEALVELNRGDVLFSEEGDA